MNTSINHETLRFLRTGKNFEKIPPAMDPIVNAAKNVEIKNAQTMMDDPKYGYNNLEPTNWNPILSMP